MEEPLPAGGSCLLGSINLSEFVVNPFTDKAYFNSMEYLRVIDIAVNGLNEVLDEGLSLHPLEEQTKTVGEYRQIGLGVMGIADMLVKLGIEYGSQESLDLCDDLSQMLLNESVIASSRLANVLGSYSKFNLKAIQESTMYLKLNDTAKRYIDNCGLRNSQLLTIPPTGSISNLIGTSGGIEPIFNISYTRKTESLHGEDVYYEVYTPIVKECMEVLGIYEGCELPNYITNSTAMTIDATRRLKMQSVWQKYIDASISSTVNLPNEATVENVYDIYMKAWELGLKGVTIYRDGCNRQAILTNKDSKVEKDNVVEEEIQSDSQEEEIVHYEIECPECGETVMANTGGCYYCLNCGHGGC